MVKTQKKSLSIILIVFIIIQMTLVGFNDLKVYATTSTPTLNLNVNNKIDVALAVGNTSVDVSTFEQDLKAALATKGNVPAANINVSAVKATQVSVANNFNWWMYDHQNTNSPSSGNPNQTPSGTPYSGQLIDDSTHQYVESYLEQNGNFNLYRHINVEDNGQTMTMKGYGAPGYKDFMYMVNTESTKKTFEFKIQELSAYDALDGGGFLFNTRVTGNYENNTQVMSGYLLFLQYNGATGQGINLYKFDNINTKALHSGSININATNFTLIASSTNYKPTDSWRHIKIEAYPSKLKMWYIGGSTEDTSTFSDDNTTSLINWDLAAGGKGTTVSLPAYSGTESYGFGPLISYRSHGCNQPTQFKFKNLTLSADKVKSLTEVVREPEWHDGTQKFIVNLNEQPIADFTDPQKEAELLSRLRSDDIYYVGWGTNSNKTESESFLNQNDLKGTFVNINDDSTNTYQEQINAIADNVLTRYNKEVGSGDAYVLTTDNVTFSATDASLTNTQDATWSEGRWKVIHDITGFDNQAGVYAYNNQYRPNLDLTFTKPGKYDIYYENTKIRTVFAHEKPVAAFDWTYDSSEGTVSYTDKSYDPDEINQTDKGIADTEWKYMDLSAGATTWTTGQAISVPANKNYLISLKVKDKFGQWSDEYTKQLSTAATAIKPIADFQIAPGTQLPYGQPITIVDKSYSPSSGSISAHNFTITKDGSSYSKTINVGNVDFTNETSGTYTISLTVKSGSDTSESVSRTLVIAPSLSDLTVNNGTLTPGFDKKTTSYNVNVGNNVTSIALKPTLDNSAGNSIKINGVTATNATTAQAINLSVGDNVINVDLISEGGATKRYQLTVNRSLPLSSNNNLSNLAINNGTLVPSFDKNVTTYSVNVADDVDSIKLTPTAEYTTGTSIKVNSVAVASGTTSQAISLNVGNNTVKVDVTSQAGTTKTYTLTVNRAVKLSTNNSLSGLSVSSGSLSPSFSSNIVAYTVNVTNSVSSIILTPTSMTTSASIKVNGIGVKSGTTSQAIGLNVGVNTINVEVISEKGTSQIYTVTVNRAVPASTNNNLSGLLISSGVLTPNFDSSVISYSANVENSVSSITITPMGATTSSAIKVNGVALASGTASNAINLNVGDNTITVEVTSESGSVKTYTIVVKRAEIQTNVSEVSLDTISKTMIIGDIMQLNATIKPDASTNKKVTWSSSDSSVATVDGNGKVTAKAIGITTITVTTEDGNHTATCSVEVKTIPVDNIEPSIISSAISKAASSGSKVAELPKTSFSDGAVALDASAVASLKASNMGVSTTIGDTKIEVPAAILRQASSLSADLPDPNDYRLEISCNDLEKVDAEVKLATKERNLQAIEIPFDLNLNLVDKYGNKTPIHNFDGNQSVTITVQLTAEDLVGRDKENLKVYYWNANTRLWELVGGTLNEADLTFTFTTTHFSVFALMDNVAVTGISFDAPPKYLEIGKTIQIQPKIAPANATNKNIMWTSSDPSVATVSNGLVTGISAGVVTITATTADGGFTTSCTIEIYKSIEDNEPAGRGGSSTSPANVQNPDQANIVLNTTNGTINAGESVQLSAKLLGNAASKTIKWTSSNENIAKVDGNGKVTAVGEGTVVITAATTDGTYTASCNITVTAPKVISKEKAVVTFVGIEHSPLIVGDTEAFYLTSINAKKVQYRIFLRSDETGITEDISNGYTDFVDTNVPYKLSLPKKFELGQYSLITWVRAEGSTEEYDSTYTAYLHCVDRDDSNRVYANDDVQISKDVYKLGETVKVDGVKNLNGIAGPYKYRLHVYNATTNKWIKNVTAYEDNIEWQPTEAGTYVLDVHIDTPNSTTWDTYLNNPNPEDVYGTYEAWKLKVITVNP